MSDTFPPDVNHPRVQGWHYWLPFVVFLGFISLYQYVGLSYPLAYVGRTFVVAGILVWLWKYYTKVRWTHLGLGVLVGVIGLFQWVGMELGLIWLRDQFPRGSTMHWLVGLTSMVKPTHAAWDVTPAVVRDWYMLKPLFETIKPESDIYVTPLRIADPTWLVIFLAIRWMGSTLVVPVMEELFWRDWLWRNMAAPNDFKLHKVGEYDKYAFWVIPVFFAFVHVQIVTAVVWALMIAWLLVKTRSIGACIVAHAVTNFLLGAWVIGTWKLQWAPMGYSQWFFW
jgi:CAAX prenyl protease-like protein